MLNLRQRWCLWAGLVFVVLVTIFPPWKCRYRVYDLGEDRTEYDAQRLDLPVFEKIYYRFRREPHKNMKLYRAGELWFPEMTKELSEDADVNAVAFRENIEFAFTMWLAQVLTVGLVTGGLMVTFAERKDPG